MDLIGSGSKATPRKKPVRRDLERPERARRRLGPFVCPEAKSARIGARPKKKGLPMCKTNAFGTYTYTNDYIPVIF